MFTKPKLLGSVVFSPKSAWTQTEAIQNNGSPLFSLVPNFISPPHTQESNNSNIDKENFGCCFFFFFFSADVLAFLQIRKQVHHRGHIWTFLAALSCMSFLQILEEIHRAPSSAFDIRLSTVLSVRPRKKTDQFGVPFCVLRPWHGPHMKSWFRFIFTIADPLEESNMSWIFQARVMKENTHRDQNV